MLNLISQWSQVDLHPQQIIDTYMMFFDHDFIHLKGKEQIDYAFLTQGGKTTCYYSPETDKIMRRLGRRLYLKEDFLFRWGLDGLHRTNDINKLLELYFLTEPNVVPKELKSLPVVNTSGLFTFEDYKLIRDLGYIREYKEVMTPLEVLSLLRLYVRTKWEPHYLHPKEKEPDGLIIIHRTKDRTTTSEASDPFDLVVRLGITFLNQSTGSDEDLKGEPLPKTNELLYGEVVVVDERMKVKPRVNGKIVVVPNCRPELIEFFKEPIMAIISDEGGAVSHAAIVAREMGISSILGAHGASIRLRTGDFVTMNMNTGEIINDNDC